MTDDPKRRICEFLGVEPEKEFRSGERYSMLRLKVSEDGDLMVVGDYKWVKIEISDLLSGKEKPVYLPKDREWTETDTADAELILRAVPRAKYVSRLWRQGEWVIEVRNDSYDVLTNLPGENLFPSLLEEGWVSLSVILSKGDPQ